jgi:nitrogen fixation protein NifU and related proteins
MSDLRELYQEVILDHGQKPRNFHPLEGATGDAEGFNPLCGDKVHVYVAKHGETIQDVAFTGDGCAISKASASLMTQAVKGRTADEVERLYAGFHAMITGQAGAAPDADALGKLLVFAGVSEFPVRVKCASLAWHTLRAALAGSHEPVTTE